MKIALGLVAAVMLLVACDGESSPSAPPPSPPGTSAEPPTPMVTVTPMTPPAEAMRTALAAHDLHISFETSDRLMNQAGEELCRIISDFKGQARQIDLLELRVHELNIAGWKEWPGGLLDLPDHTLLERVRIANLFLGAYCPT